VESVEADPARVKEAIERLGERVDAIYVHIDWDVLDPRDIPTAGLPVPKGPRLNQLAEVVSLATHHPKAALLGYAAFNADRDTDGSVAQNLAQNIVDALK
jgi:arginase